MESMSVLDPAGRTKRLVDMNSPSEQWRDNLFNMFANGILHPMALLSIFAPHGKISMPTTSFLKNTADTLFSCSFSRTNHD